MKIHPKTHWILKRQTLQLKQSTALQHLLTAPIQVSQTQTYKYFSACFQSNKLISTNGKINASLCISVGLQSILLASSPGLSETIVTGLVVHHWCHFATLMPLHHISSLYNWIITLRSQVPWRKNEVRGRWMRLVPSIPKSLIWYAHTVRSFAGDFSGVQIHARKVFVAMETHNLHF